MKKGYYIAQIDFETIKNATVGVSKKISDQISFFNSLPDTKCEFISFSQKLGKLKRLLSFFKKTQYNSFYQQLSSSDFFYIRAIIPCTRSLVYLLRRIKNNKPSCKIIWEIPTYPYDYEMKTLKLKIFRAIDKINRRKLKKVVDYISTFSNDKYIFGVPTLHISNGIDIKRIPVKLLKEKNEREINLIAVAQFDFWHGFDRLIEGLINYYVENENPKYTLKLHLVGSDSRVNYKSLLQNTTAINYVTFHGELSGEKLDEVFVDTDIAFCSLGCHRKGLLGKTSELKSREYLARGLPIVSSSGIDIIPDNYEYLLKVSDDDSAINMNEIVNFYKRIYMGKKNSEVVAEIRSFAEEKCTMEYGMKEVSNYLNS